MARGNLLKVKYTSSNLAMSDNLVIFPVVSHQWLQKKFYHFNVLFIKCTATKSLHWHRRTVCKTDLVAFVGRELWRHQAEKRRANHSQKVVMWVSQKQRAKWNFQVNLTTWPSEPRAKAQDLYVIYWYIAAMEIFSILLRNSLNTPVYLEFWMVQKSLSTPPVFSVEKHSQFKTKECKNCFFFLTFSLLSPHHSLGLLSMLRSDWLSYY